MQAFVVCDSISRDADTQKVVLFGIFDRIFCTRVPAAHPHMAAFFRIRMPSGTTNADVGLVVHLPSGARQETAAAIPALVADNGIMQGIINMHGFPIPAFGRYAFELRVNGKSLATFEMAVEESGAPRDARLQ